MILISTNVNTASLDYPTSHPVFGYENKLTAGMLSADEAASGFAVTNLANPATYLKWKATTTAEQYITIRGLPSQTYSYVGIAGHNFGTAGVTISIEKSNADSPETWSEIFEQTLLTDDEPLVLWIAAQTLSDIRIRLAGDGSPVSLDAIPQAGTVYVGSLLQMERSFPVTGQFRAFPFGKQVDAVDGNSGSGDFLGRIVLREYQTNNVSFDYMTLSWYRTNFVPFLAAAATRPFFFAHDPSGASWGASFAWLAADENFPMADIDPITERVMITLPLMGTTQ